MVSEDVARLNPELSAGQEIKVARRRPVFRLDQVAPEPAFRSDTERRAWREWVPEQNPLVALYEPFIFRLKSCNYKPDFALLMRDGELWLVEVKGSWKAYQSGQASKRALIEAAQEFAWLGHWFSLMPTPKRRGGWELKEYGNERSG